MGALEELEAGPASVTWLPLGERSVRQGWPLDRDLSWPELKLSLGPEQQLAAWRRATGRAAPAPAPERLISTREEGRLRARLEQLSTAQRRAGSLPAWPPRRRVPFRPRGRYCRALSTSPAQRAVSAEPEQGGTKMDKKSLPSGPQMAIAVLEEAARPVHVKLIAARVLEQDRQRRKPDRAYNGKTPEQTISAALTVSSNGTGPFVKTAPGVFALRDWPASKRNKRPELPEKKPAAAASDGGNGGSSSGSGSGRKRSGSQASKGSGEASPPAKKRRKTKAEKDAVLAEAQQQEQPAEAEAPAAA